jgi:hypothetical protein
MLKLFRRPSDSGEINSKAVDEVLSAIFDNRNLTFSLLWTAGYRVFLLGLEARKYQVDSRAGWVPYLDHPVVDEDGEISIELSNGLEIEPGEKYEIRFLALAPKSVPKAIATLTDDSIAVQIAPTPPKIQELKGNTPWSFRGTYTTREETIA